MKTSCNRYTLYLVLVCFCVLSLPMPVLCQLMQYKATEVIQISSPVFQGNKTARILKVEIVTQGTTLPITLKNFHFNTRGTTRVSDLSNARVFYTGTTDIGDNQMPSTATELGTVVKKPNGKTSFSFNQKLASGTNYFWLTYDIANNAMPGNVVDATLDSILLGDTMYFLATKSPIGNRKVENYATYCATKVGLPNALLNKQIGITEVKIGNDIHNSSSDLDAITFYPTPRLSAYRMQEIPVEIKAGKGLPEQIIGWADWDNDGYLDKTSEEIFFTKKQAPGIAYKTTFKVPCHASTGIHKIRIASDYFLEQKPEPCNNLIYGETEEYLIEIFDDVNLKASFFADTPAYQSSEIIFINTSTAEGNVTYEWDYNFDGLYDESALNGSFIYLTPGWKKIRLKLTQTSCDSVKTRIYTDSIKIVFPSVNAVADFISSENTAPVNERVFLVDNSSEKPNYWRWKITPEKIGNNAAFYYTDGTDSTSQNPVVIFNYSGNYTVSLTAANATGKKSTETKKDYIKVVGNIRLCQKSSVDTALEQSGYLYDNGGKNSIYNTYQKCFALIKPPCAESIELTFNHFDVSAYMSASGGDYLRVYDGTSNTGLPLHDSAGYKNGFQNQLPDNSPILPPKLTARSGTMFIEWSSDSAYIGDGFEAQWITNLQKIPKPKALFTNAASVYEKQQIHFTNTSEGDNLTYFWDLDNDGIIDSTTEDAVFHFDSAGTYTIMLAVANCGGTDTIRKTVTVLKPNAKPVAEFTAPFVAYREGDVVAFTDLSTNHPYYYNWVVIPNVYSHGYEFVNGTNEHSQHPQIKFYDAGLYSIRLEIANSLGTDAQTKANYIEVSSQCVPETKTVSTDVGINHVKLTNISGQNIINQQSASGEKAFTLYSYANPVLLEVGATYNLEVKRNSTFNKIKGSVWIDYNDNGFFNDPGELVLKEDSVADDTWGGKITIYSAINPGISRMRIGVTYSGKNIITCGGGTTIAEFEDYTIVLSTDQVKPEITLLGRDTVIIEEGRTYTDSGATAFDNVDGDITRKIKVTNLVDESNTGTYSVIYQVRDTAGNIATKERIVHVIADTTAPVIALLKGDSIYLEIYNKFTDPGFFAYDNVTEAPVVSVSGKVDTAKFGVYLLTYSTIDSNGNKTERIRRVYVNDTTAPTINFLSGDPVKWQIFRPYKDSGVSVKDNYWPEIQLTKQHSINVNKAGTYTVTYTAKDGSGNISTKSRKVLVGDYIPPQLILPYDTFVLDVHGNYTDPPVRMTDNFYANTQLKLVRVGFVHNHLVSTNILKYYAQDPAGNLSAPQTLVVLVKDREAPSITLNGSTTIYLKRWQKFFEEGYIITDNYDTFCTVEIGGNFVNSHVAGTYARIYRAKDKSGNYSKYVARIIHVEESTSSINDNEENDNPLKCFPNPAAQNLYISARLDIMTPVNIYMTDALGKTVKTIWQGNYKDAILSANVRDLANGIYFLHFVADGQKLTRKIIISK